MLKHGYRKKNIYDVDSLVSTLNENRFVTAERSPKFRDWDSQFDLYYERPKSGNVWKYHCFEVDSEKAGTDRPCSLLSTRRSMADDAEEITQQFYKELEDITQWNRKELLEGNAVQLPAVLERPGIRPIKKNELFKKFRPYVPPEYHHLEMYQPPSKEEMDRYKAHSDAKKKLNEAAKQQEAEQARKRKRDDPVPV